MVVVLIEGGGGGGDWKAEGEEECEAEGVGSWATAEAEILTVRVCTSPWIGERYVVVDGMVGRERRVRVRVLGRDILCVLVDLISFLFIVLRDLMYCESNGL